MKNKIKKLLIVITAFLLIILSVVPAFAETIYIVNGYSYSIYQNDAITLEGWDTSINAKLTLPDSLGDRYFVNVANWAFENNKELTGLDFSQANHLLRIGYESFIGCSNVKTPIVLPNSVINLNERSFSGCSSVPYINIYANVVSIPRECFYGCSSAESIILPDSLQVIEPWAFGNCTSLLYAELPKSITEIAPSAFKNDPNLLLGVYKNTVGQQYAEENKIDHIILDGDKIGDVNGDGVVDILDATEIQKYAAESTDFTDEQFELGDINKDGYCDVIDALLVQKSVIGAYELPQNIIRY